jgi:hypothetical protein
LPLGFLGGASTKLAVDDDDVALVVDHRQVAAMKTSAAR